MLGIFDACPPSSPGGANEAANASRGPVAELSAGWMSFGRDEEGGMDPRRKRSSEAWGVRCASLETNNSDSGL